MNYIIRSWPELKNSWPSVFIVASIIVLGVFWYTATKRPFTDLESFFWQFFGIAIGAVGTFYRGRKSADREAQDAAREIIKSHALPAFRQLLSLRTGLLQQSYIIEATQDYDSCEDYRIILSELAGLNYMQQLMVVDALGGWEDIVPEEVEKLKKKLSAENTTEDSQ